MSSSDFSDDLVDGMLGDFLDEAGGLLMQLNEQLLLLDQWAKTHDGTSNERPIDLLNEMFRAAHSIKGLSGMMRLNDINILTHRIENVFDATRNLKLPLTPEVVEVVFAGIDCLAAMIEGLKDGGANPPSYSAELQRIEATLQRHNAQKEIGSQKSVEAQLDNVAALVDEAQANLAPATPEVDPFAQIVDDTDIPPKYLAIFLDEAGTTLEELSDALLSPLDAAGMETLLVACHRLKGSAASIGLQKAARVAHVMEDLIQVLRRDNSAPTTQDCDALLQSVDAFRGYLAGLKEGRPETSALAQAYLRLAARDECETSPAANTSAVASVDSAERQLTLAWQAAPELCSGFVGQIRFDRELPLVELKARLLLEKLHRAGELFYCSPAEDELEEIGESRLLTIGVATSIGSVELQRELRVDGVSSIQLSELSRKSEVNCSTEPESAATANIAAIVEPVRSANAALQPDAKKARPSETVRVDIERLDQLMSLAGQLVINKARFAQIGAKLKSLTLPRSMANSLGSAQLTASRLCQSIQESSSAKANGSSPLAAMAEKLQEELAIAQRDLANFGQLRTVIADLSEAVHQLGRVSDGIQDNVMETRMVPIGPLFTRFKRAVRDLTRDNQKDVHLDIHGENTELDKRMIDELSDPLIHLVRNSVDHGIESADIRAASGKSRQGTVTLNAYHRGNRIVIEVSDDGKGLDAERIRRKGLDKGLITEVEAEKMTPDQLFELIWKPGFSTAERVTEVSGRGMGMDIVRSKIEQLNGTVDVTSEPGRGTVFAIHLPLTMAILPSLLTVIENDVFSIPVESVIEIVRVNSDEIASVHMQKAIRVRGRVVSLVDLHDVFRWNNVVTQSVPRDTLTVVIVGGQAGEIGLIVDDLLGEQDVVIKSLAENFRNVEGVAGASILGDGRVSLILDIAALLDLTYRKSKVGTSAPVSEPSLISAT